MTSIMKLHCLLVTSLLALFAEQAVSVKVATPASVHGRLTGHVTFHEAEDVLFRVKRQSGRRPRPERTRRPNRVTISPPVPPDAPATSAASTASTTSTTTTTTAPSSCGAEVYRTLTGYCNNEANPFWGSVESPFLRLMDPQYTILSNDGQEVFAPRTFSNIDGFELPSARAISRRVHDPLDRPDNRPIMAMQWGQFIDHDITSTPINPTEKTCCSESLVLSGRFQHEDFDTQGPCFPILIDDEDPHFTTIESRCMENKRSFQVPVNGKPEQINLITAFIDGSAVYGSNEVTMNKLRSNEKGPGRLLELNDNLPRGENTTCLVDGGREALDYCLIAGDTRVNVYPGLGALHTVFMRMHNLVADGLAGVNPTWDDEKVFQETRRIIGALLQKITYLEWLRSILGNTELERYRLTNGGFEYEPNTNPTLFNSFSAAAFRFGHSMVTDTLTIDGVAFEAIDLFNRPRHVLHSLPSLLEGLLADVAQRTDRWYSTGMTNHMFETLPRTGFDIVSLNIQRGRDHGLPPYNDWREMCGLGRIAFADMGRDERVYSGVYRNVDDIDLYSGALHERPVAQGAVGETYACLIGRQFENLKFGDRFWYENPTSPKPFTAAQIRAIERQSLATVLCQTVVLTSVQRNAFLTLDETRNPAIDCSTVTPLDYSLFTD